MISYPLDNIHGRTTSSVTCHNVPLTAHTVGLRRACQAIIALGMHIRWNDVSHGMPSFPLEGIHNRTTLGVAYYHRPLIAHSIERCWASCSCKAIRQHTLSDKVRSDVPSLHLDNTQWKDVRHGNPSSPMDTITWSEYIGHGMPSWPLSSTHGRMT